MASQQTPPKKPRLSLQIKTSVGQPVQASRPQRTYTVDPKDPTAFNTLSNAYVTAVERSTPITAINTLQAFSIATPVDYQDSKHRVATPYVANYPETPVSAHPSSPQPMEIVYPSTMTATPPLSGTLSATRDSTESKVFTFASKDTEKQREQQAKATRSGLRVAAYRTMNGSPQIPYTHPRILHSILRNSPLPPRTAIPPPSPRRQSLRLAEKAARRVEYDSPIEQEIVTNKYTRSHIDLLTDDASPNTPSSAPELSEEALDVALAFAPNEIQDGGQTPGPFEETRRRVAGISTGAPATPAGVRKRKRREKKRCWVWTIGQEDEDETQVSGAVAATRAGEAAKRSKANDTSALSTTTLVSLLPETDYEEIPTPSIETNSESAWSESRDIEMTDSSSVASDTQDRLSLAPSESELDLKTPTAPQRARSAQRDTPVPELASQSRRDTPIPPEQLAQKKRDTPIPEYLLEETSSHPGEARGTQNTL